MKNILLVGFGGAAGSIVRYLISWAYSKYQPTNISFPYPTFIANMLGCILIGLLMAYVLKDINLERDAFKLLLVTGFCGGFTTFSSFSFETIQLIQNQQTTTAILYVCMSLVLGLGLTFGTYSLFK